MKKFAGLEVCRFLCALTVVVFHYQHFLSRISEVDPLSRDARSMLPLSRLLAPVYQEGYVAVQIFWTVSGFIFFWKYRDAIHKRLISGAKFFVLRFSRLYPLHLVTLLLVAGLQYLYIRTTGSSFIYRSNDTLHFLMQLGMASNWTSYQRQTFNGPIWSISAEVLAYLCFFLLARFIRPGWILCFTVIIMTKGILILYFPDEPVLNCIHFFFIGGLVQRLVDSSEERFGKIVFLVSGTASLLLVAAMCLGYPSTRTSSALLAACVVCWFTLLDSVSGRDLSRISCVGNLTYSSYLIHFPIQLSMVLSSQALGLQPSLFLSPWALGLYVVSTFGLAFGVYRYFEIPMQDAIRSWSLLHPRRPILDLIHPRAKKWRS